MYIQYWAQKMLCDSILFGCTILYRGLAERYGLLTLVLDVHMSLVAASFFPTSMRLRVSTAVLFLFVNAVRNFVEGSAASRCP